MSYLFASAGADLKQLLHHLNQHSHAALFGPTPEDRDASRAQAQVLTEKIEHLIRTMGSEVRQAHTLLTSPGVNLIHAATQLVELMLPIPGPGSAPITPAAAAGAAQVQ